jgi:outer membrane receptor for ferrienterochelin and colicin
VGYGYDHSESSWQMTGYYRLNRDSTTDVTVYTGNGFSLTTKANLPKNDSVGLELTASGHLAPKLGYSLSGNLFRSQIDATALGVPGLQSTSGVNAKLKLDYRPTARTSAQLTATRAGKRLTPQGYVSAVNIVNLGYRHQFDTGLTAIFTASDVFNGQHYERFASAPSFTAHYLRSVQGRVLYLGVLYTFGSGKKGKAESFDFDQGE